MKNYIYLLLFFSMLLLPKAVFSAVQEDKDSLSADSSSQLSTNELVQKSPLSDKKPIIIKGVGDDNGMPITFYGNYRLNTMYRNLHNHYASVKGQTLNFGGFGDGTQPLGGVPLLTLGLNSKPNPNADINFAIAINHIMTGSLDADSTRGKTIWGQTFGVNSSFKTKYGKIKFGAGNQFSGMSQLFSGWSEIRWNPFYRLPWDESAKWGGSWSTYDNTYVNGSGTQFNATFASGGRTQGIVLQLSELPGDFGLNLSYGVDGQTGLLIADTDTSDMVSRTKKTLGGRLYKKHNANTYAITGILNNGFIDNVSDLRETQHMVSTDANLVFPNVTLNAEMGFTAFTSPFGVYNGLTSTETRDTIRYKSGTDFLIDFKANIKKEAFGIPLMLRVYQLGYNYVNLNSGVFNTSTYNNSSAYVQINSQWDVAMRKGFIVNTGQAANNRRAVELMTKAEKGRFKFNFSSQLGQDVAIDTNTALNQVMFYHHLNPWSRASFEYWTPVAGPYRKLLSNYIQLLERVPITDAVVNYRKSYLVFNADSRYKTTFLGKSLILTHYFSYQAASEGMGNLFGKDAFVRVFYNEAMAYLQANKNTVFVGHLGYNKALGGYRTQLSSDNGKPINQNSFVIGGGIDWNFAPNMGLYFRELWMTHKDKNFKLDQFDGFETTVEMKIFF